MTRKEAIKILKGAIKKPNTKDGYLGQAIDMAINSLEIDERYELEYEQIEPCEDAISRQAVLDLISKFILEIHTEGGRDLNAHTNDVLRQILRNVGSDRVLPSVNPQEPKTDVLDKIIAEIKETRKRRNVGVMECLDIIDRYKAESETEKNMPKYCDDCVLLSTDGCSMGGSAKGCEACDDFMTEREVEE